MLVRRALALAFCAAAAMLVMGAAPRAPKKRISVDLKDADIHNVLRLIADVSGANLVVGDQVTGRVTLKVKSVPWDEVLAAVLVQKGLGSEHVGGILYVDTLENLARRSETALSIKKKREQAAPLRTVIIPVRNARAASLAPIVKGLLTERGSVTVDERTNTLIVTDADEEIEARIGEVLPRERE